MWRRPSGKDGQFNLPTERLLPNILARSPEWMDNFLFFCKFPGMNQTDLRILTEIQPDSTLSLENLSGRVGLSRNACWRRLHQLEAEGYIAGRPTLLDATRLNVGLMVFIAIRTSEHSTEWLKAFRQAVINLPEIIGVFRMSGDIDYLLQAVVPDVAAYDGLYQRLIAKVKLSDVSSSFVMEKIKMTTALPLSYLPTAERR